MSRIGPPSHGDSVVYDPEMPHWAVRLEAKVNDIRESQRRVEVAVHGTDENPAVGLRVRVDRLEQSEQRRNWIAGIAMTAAIGAMLTTVWAKLTGKG